MKNTLNAELKKFSLWFNRLNKRETSLIVFTSFCLLAFAFYSIAEAVQEKLQDTKRLTVVRQQNLENISHVASRYKTLRGRLDRLEESFAKSEMTFEEVTKEIDAIVRKSIGSDNYDLKKGRTPSQIGFEYEKQQFTLNITSIKLEEVVKLLYNLEKGESPLILGKVDLRKLQRDQQFSASLEIFSVRKSKA